MINFTSGDEHKGNLDSGHGFALTSCMTLGITSVLWGCVVPLIRWDDNTKLITLGHREDNMIE